MDNPFRVNQSVVAIRTGKGGRVVAIGTAGGKPTCQVAFDNGITAWYFAENLARRF
jgi:hypothetical protein